MAATVMSEQDQLTLSEAFLEKACNMPGCEKVKTCIQCGTCSASCPTAYAWDYTPREIIASVRAGMLEKVLQSNTVWMCASCYSCTVRCPSGIKFTELMYELKRVGIERGLYPRGARAPVMSKTFMGVVNYFGRSMEMVLLILYYLKTNPFVMLKALPLSIKMFLTGRLDIFPKQIKGHDDLVKMLAVAKEKGE
jgi:heterodisulfide reductase subunit C